MDMNEKLEKVLGLLKNPAKAELKDALAKMGITLEELDPLIRPAGDKPYYRKLIFKNDEVELLVMNWSELDCAPHDHGSSHGWIQVINGVSVNTVYEVDGNGVPKEQFSEQHAEGTKFYAPKKGIHKMQRAEGTSLVTLHLYSPPITGMKVYDLEKCAACVVSDECGAWWPDEDNQKMKEIKLGTPRL
jgi:cysteine dioxygenase